MTSATQATELLIHAVPSPSLSAAERGRGLREKSLAIKWAVLIHLALIAVLVLIKAAPPGHFEEYLTIDPVWNGGTAIGCPGPNPERPDFTRFLEASPSAIPLEPEVAALPTLEITAVDAKISQLLNRTTYDALHRGSGQLGTSMFEPGPLSPLSRRISLPAPFDSLPAIPSMLFFSPVAIPGPAVDPGLYNNWTRKR